MDAFNPNNRKDACEAYLSRALDTPVSFLAASLLNTGSRRTPWRLHVALCGGCRSFVLRLNPEHGDCEYSSLGAMAGTSVPTPRAYGWDPIGSALGVPCFMEDFITGEPLLPYLLAGEWWAEDLYVDTVCRLQALEPNILMPVIDRLAPVKTADYIIADAGAFFRQQPDGLADAVMEKLAATTPPPLPPCFSNGDLYPDNFLVRENKLAGVIDWEHAGLSDPLYEFLIVFSAHPELRGRGTEERYLRRRGFDREWLCWYRGLEYLTSWVWTLRTGQSFHRQTRDNLRHELQQWLTRR
jgi:aminoglycoside phosphotransferase (APT) family kinase protein